MGSISERIAFLVKELGYNKNSFSKAIGIGNNVTIGRIINENRDPSFEVLSKIVQTFGNRINTKWLLTGEGSMETPDPITVDGSDLTQPYVLRDKEDLRKIITNLEFLSESMKTELKKLKTKID